VTRGRLRVYLGAAPGVGKTYAALEEMHRLVASGVDAVVGLVESHGRRETEAVVSGLEVVPRRSVMYRGRLFTEMDLPAVLARAPEVALVDELAHTNVPGVSHGKRWEDVEVLLDAGIHVVSTVNIQHLESLNDVIADITGVPQREIIPDDIVRRADEIELVDLTQEGIRDRLAAGKIYPADRVDAALSNFFRAGNLGALRELALSWTADRVDEAVDRYRRDHGIDHQWETRERVVVGVTGDAGGEDTIRRAARMAMRARGTLLGVHVRADDGLATAATDRLLEQRALVVDLGGEYHEMSGGDIGDALIEFAVSQNATQLVVGATRRSRLQRLLRGTVVEEVIRRAGDIDVHVISGPAGGVVPPPRPRRRAALPRRRRALGWLAALFGFVVATPLMVAEREDIGLQSVLLVYLLVAAIAAWIGGFGPAIGAAVVGFVLANYYFTPPYQTWTIDSSQDVFALVAFIVVAGAMGALVGLTARRASQVRQARAEIETLGTLASAAETDSLDQLVVRLQVVLDLAGASVLVPTGSGWQIETSAGAEPPSSVQDADRVVEIDGAVLAVSGRAFTGADERLFRAYASQIASAFERHRLARKADEVEVLSRADELRTALLRAVSHDLRSPLSAIKANVTSLLQDDVAWTDAQEHEFLEGIHDETNRLDHVVSDLLDAGRIQAGAVTAHLRSVGLEEVVASALTGLAEAKVSVAVDETLPRVDTDPGLLERVVENLVRNALRHEPESSSVLIDAGHVGDRIDLRVVDHGPGVPAADRERIFQPFQRLDDGNTSGVGLGLAVAMGLCEAMGHQLTIEDTLGGGTTMIVSMRASP
jgi:two-component system, OmpR family, sensor histidine kinase KdpD